MSNKIKYGLIPVLYLVGIYLGSFLVNTAYPNQRGHLGPGDAFYAINDFVHLPNWLFENTYTLLWLSQFAAISTFSLYVLGIYKLTNINWKIFIFSLIVPIVFWLAFFISYISFIVPINNKIYGFEGAIMGPIGILEEFIFNGFISIPLLVIIARLIGIGSGKIKPSTIASTSTYIAVYILNKLTINLWFHPL